MNNLEQRRKNRGIKFRVSDKKKCHALPNNHYCCRSLRDTLHYFCTSGSRSTCVDFSISGRISTLLSPSRNRSPRKAPSLSGVSRSRWKSRKVSCRIGNVHEMEEFHKPEKSNIPIWNISYDTNVRECLLSSFREVFLSRSLRPSRFSDSRLGIRFFYFSGLFFESF